MAAAHMYSTYQTAPWLTFHKSHFSVCTSQGNKIRKYPRKMASQSSKQAHINSKYALPNNKQNNMNGKGKHHSGKGKSSMIHIWLDPQVLENLKNQVCLA
jgi:hypothetical protein